MLPSTVQNAFFGLREYVTPVLKTSNFLESGVLTPEEFVAAGDFLVFKCPTWSWESGIENQRKPYLPNDKQYLITRNVPSFKRAIVQDEILKELFSEVDIADLTEDNKNDWVVAKDLPENVVSESRTTELKGAENVMMDIDLANAMLFTNEELYGTDMNKAFQSNLIRTRTYDLSMSYDKYYQVPRLWLQGYDEQGIPLKAQQIFEDVSQEHARKTITMEPHPHLPITMASIHPCKHANVMKKMMEVLQQEQPDKALELRVDQYLVLFLKFISSILPTIDYDYTLSLE